MITSLNIILINTFLLFFAISPANASCKNWRDKFGTAHNYCDWGVTTNYTRRFRNGTRTKQDCTKIGSTMTNCTSYTNGRRVGSQDCSNFGVMSTCNYKDQYGRTYKLCTYNDLIGWQCTDY